MSTNSLDMSGTGSTMTPGLCPFFCSVSVTTMKWLRIERISSWIWLTSASSCASALITPPPAPPLAPLLPAAADPPAAAAADPEPPPALVLLSVLCSETWLG